MSKYISLKRNIPTMYYIVFAAVIFGSLFLWQMSVAQEGTIAATVTATNLAVSVADGTIAFGTVALDASTTTVTAGNDTQVITNDGSDAKLNVKSSNATGGATPWNLNTTNSTDDNYTLEVSTTSGSAYMFLPDDTTYITASSTFPTGAVTQDLDFRLTTPQVVSDFSQKSITITVQVVSQ